MEGPVPTSSLYVTLGHEYGFAGANLESLLHICGFDEITFVPGPRPATARQRLGRVARWPYLASSRTKHRFFGVNHGGQFGTELVVKATRRDFLPLMSEQYR